MTSSTPISKCDQPQHCALNAVSRAINHYSTYGHRHRAVEQAVSEALQALDALFAVHSKLILGSHQGRLTVNGAPIEAVGSLQRSLQQRLCRLQIVGLRLEKGITETELYQLIALLAHQRPEQFSQELDASDLAHIHPETVEYQAVHEGETVAEEAMLHRAEGGAIVIDADDGLDDAPSIEIGEIVAFLDGGKELTEEMGDELRELASDPARLGQMILESVSIRQKAAPPAGESLNDIILGCLRRTFDGIRKQPSLQTPEGMADLKNGLLLLEETMLERMRSLTGASDPELDRQIVQAIHDMEENLDMELTAHQCFQHKQAFVEQEEKLESMIRARGADTAAEILAGSGLPPQEWKRLVANARNQGNAMGVAAGLSSLTTVLEKLETMMQAQKSDQQQMKKLLGEADASMDSTIFSTKAKLEDLQKQVHEETGTIGGQANEMDRKELLSSLAEIAQELMQPLTAVHAAIEMMNRGYCGEMSEDQSHMLHLAGSGTDNLKYLLRKLIGIVGVPINRGVDERFALPETD